MNLKEKRKEKGLTLEALSEATGIDKGRLSEIERGKYNSTIETLHKIAKGLNSELIIEFK